MLKKIKNLYTTAIVIILSTFAAIAQESSKLDVNVDLNGAGDSGGAWYSQTWVWIVGGLVFILLLVALLRGGGNNNK